MKKFLKDESSKRQLIIYTLSGMIIVAFYFLLANIALLKAEILRFTAILKPFIWGTVFAFLMNSTFKRLQQLLARKLKEKTATVYAAITAILILILVIVLFLLVLIPQLWLSFQDLVSSFETYLTLLKQFFDKFALDFHISPQIINSVINFAKDFLSVVLGTIQSMLPTAIDVTLSTISSISSLIIGFIIAIYILMEKKKLFAQARRLAACFLPVKVMDFLRKVIFLTVGKFNGFVSGKIIDSLIIGVLCFAAMRVLKLNYSVLISFIVGLTNIIPVFGPFIGAVPGAFILLMVEPFQCLIFIIMILVLQQLDGNIIGPHILGDSVGISSFWIMFAIIAGGGYFGVTGMFIAVPVFSIIYQLVKEAVERYEQAKNKKEQIVS